MFIIARESRLRVALLLPVMVCFFGCAPQVEFVVEVLDIPGDAAQVELQPWHQGASLQQFAPRVAVVSGRSSLTVLLRLNDTALDATSVQEPLMIAVAALDSENCISATGVASRSQGALDNSTISVSLIPSRGEFSLCPSVPRPILRDRKIDISLDEASNLDLSGWGFSERMQLRAKGDLQSVQIKSPLNLTLATSGLPRVPGAVLLELEDPSGGQSDPYPDLLRVALAEVSNHTMVTSLPSESINQLIDFSVADLDYDGRPELVILEAVDGEIYLRRFTFNPSKEAPLGLKARELGSSVHIPELQKGKSVKLAVSHLGKSGSFGVIFGDKGLWTCTNLSTQPVCAQKETEVISGVALYDDGGVATMLLSFRANVVRYEINQVNGALMKLDLPFGSDFTACAVAAADLNLDGKVDLIAIHKAVAPTSLSLAIAVEQGPFKLSEYKFKPGVSCSDKTQIAVGDVDGDGLSDIWVNASTGIFLNRMKRQSTLGQFEFTDTSESRQTEVAILDLNADTLGDLVWNTEGQLAVLRSLGKNFTKGISYLGLGSYKPVRLLVADMDGNGKQDLVLGDQIVLVH